MYATAVGPDGALWFGTDHGASRFHGKAWATYTYPQPVLYPADQEPIPYLSNCLKPL